MIPSQPSSIAAFLFATFATLAVAAEGDVSVHDSGPKVAPVTFECTRGHQAETHLIRLESAAARYEFRSSGCMDPSHGDQRPSAEGNFGMPAPSSANWYWGGFFSVLINGVDATRYRVAEMRATESGPRGAFQILWAHPDADVGLRIMLLPGANHVLADLVWRPRAQGAVKNISIQLRCYPSFFTTARQRKGDRHCRTPRTDMNEPHTLKLDAAQDTYLYFYDTVFDVAKGEGDGPCAVLLPPGPVRGGAVHIGDYAVTTQLVLDPDAGKARLAFYDFAGLKNADAEAYLKAHAADDLARLVQADFRPQPVRTLDVARLKSEAARLLSDAADDGVRLKPKVEELLSRVISLKEKADQGDWTAEADLAGVLDNSADLFWKLRTLAVLNNPPQ